MNYEIIIDKAALKFIQKQPSQQRQRILSAIKRLPNEGDIKAMRGYRGYFRLRVGDYRIIYTLDNNKLIIRIINVGNRGDVYK